MATLTETAYYTRKIIRYSIYLGILLVIAKLAFDLALIEYRKRNPLPPPKPEVSFGRLPSPKYPDTKLFSGPVRYILDTIDETFPESSPSAKIYFTPAPPASFLTMNRVQGQASEWTFTGEAESLSPTVYRWNDHEKGRSITIDGLTGNFVYRYTYELDSDVFRQSNLPQAETALREATNLLASHYRLGDRANLLLEPSIQNGETALTYYRYENNSLVPTLAPSQAQAVRVDFAREPLEGIPIFPADPDNSPISILFSGANDDRRILEIRYTTTTIDLNTASTYPVRTSREAWTQLQAGKATLIKIPKHDVREIPIRSISFAYIVPITRQDYMQPAWVFQGEEFLALVPAVTDEWLNQEDTGSQE